MVKTQWLTAGIMALGLLAACSPGEGATARAQTPDAGANVAIVRHPVSGLEVIDLVVDRG